MRAYRDFYEATPSDTDLAAILNALIAEPDSNGVQFIARNSAGKAIGFATLFWSWTTRVGGDRSALSSSPSPSTGRFRQ